MDWWQNLLDILGRFELAEPSPHLVDLLWWIRR